MLHDIWITTILMVSVGITTEVIFTAVFDYFMGSSPFNHDEDIVPEESRLSFFPWSGTKSDYDREQEIKTQSNSRKMVGYTYLWMVPIYALLPVLFTIAFIVYPTKTYLRHGLEVLIVLATEYVVGYFFDLISKCPWKQNYLKSKYNIHGFIRVDYVPAWFVACMIWEYIYVYLTRLT